jgi:ABC-type sulfate/molybdate transport systems ATPase subunit
VVREEGVACLWVSHDPEEALEVAGQVGHLHQGSLEGPLSTEQALRAPPSKAFAERFGRVDWFPISQVQGTWRWGLPSSEVTWPLPAHLISRAHQGAQVGVRDSGWVVLQAHSLERDGEREEVRPLEMRVARSWPQPWGRALELRGTEGATKLSVKTLTRDSIGPQERVWLHPREVFLVG